MDISIDARSGETTVSIAGHLDQYSISSNFWASDQASALADVAHFVVTMKTVDRVDTAGLAWLLNLLRDARGMDKICELRDVPSRLIDLAKLSGAQVFLQNGVENDK